MSSGLILLNDPLALQTETIYAIIWRDKYGREAVLASKLPGRAEHQALIFSDPRTVEKLRPLLSRSSKFLEGKTVHLMQYTNKKELERLL